MASILNCAVPTCLFGSNGRGQVNAQIRAAMDELFVGLLEDISRKLGDERISQRQVNRALDDLILALRTRKFSSSDDEWRDFISICRRHPLKDLLHQDPFTHRAFSKPRGYPGDAELLDLLYGREEQWPVPESSPIGRRIFNYTTLAPAPEGVRARRGFIADLLDRLASELREPRVLSIGAGHLREANLAAAVKRSRFGRFLALDSDAMSLKEVERCYACFGVETINATIRKLLTGQLDLGKFDLVYSTGLFDYLQQSTGRRLVWSIFQMLRPGGRLLVANFLPGIRDVGYMEAFMDWQLTYRTRQEMIEITMDIPQSKIRDVTLFAEENQNIIFLEVTRN